MDKIQFNTLLQHVTSSTEKEAVDVNNLKKKYPYSQVLHSLTARTAKDHQWNNHAALLQQAAVYCSDRSVLKELMTTPYEPRTSKPSIPVLKISTPVKETAIKETVLPKKSTATKETELKPVLADVPQPLGDQDIDYADAVIEDLARLKELKHKFELLFADASLTQVKKATTQTEVAGKETAGKKETVEEKKETKPKKRKSKRERIIELAKQLNQPEEKDTKETVKGDGETDPLIKEIKTKKKKIKPENEKTREQIEIINQFIKSKPTLSPPKIQPTENIDLASTLKSGEFGDNIVSETLAEILIRQGKKDKAIEVYKKLIWKFPQKKAYFAAQIEELKK